MATVSFTQQIYSREVLQSFIKKLAPIHAFSVDASPTPEQLGTVVKLSIVKNTTVASTPGSVVNFEIDGGELDEIDVTLSQTQCHVDFVQFPTVDFKVHDTARSASDRCILDDAEFDDGS